jgi:uncharacterized protein YndB with AHSA1/START domain
MSTQKIQTVIAATPEQVWAAITDRGISPAYYFGFAAHYGDLTAGASYEYRVGDDVMIGGELLEVEEGARVSMTFRGRWTPAVADLPESIVTYDLGPTAMAVPGLTQLTLIHEGLPDSETARDVEKGWVLILSGMKTLLETGRPLVPAPSH